MIPSMRQQFNQAFTEEAYRNYIKELENVYPGQLDFRVAETPIFIPKEFTQKMLDACDAILEQVSTDEYRKQSDKAIPAQLNVPGQNEYPHCIAFDFGICLNDKGELEPQLIEMQGFPTLFAWEAVLPEIYERHFWCPEGYSVYLGGFDKASYIELLKRVIIGDTPVENVILLEIFPEKQKTRVDFSATEDLLGIKAVCLTSLIQEGKDLYYMRDGIRTKVERIYNRLIFDDLFQQAPEVQEKGAIMMQELNVTWVPHPNWFYRLSKFTLPFIDHPYVPQTRFLSDVKSLPDDLQNYVVKPLFSFAGQGVIIDVTREQVEKITDPENWIIQRKVQYASVIQTPDEPAKAEIRLFYFWEQGAKLPVAANNLSRLSKGKMVGVRYNKDKSWVGGSFCLFEQ
ncbi:MAG TPA: hypothetical protein VF609_10975 [Flavisolibacter sp.]